MFARGCSSYLVHWMDFWSLRGLQDPPRDRKVFHLGLLLWWEGVLSIQAEGRLTQEGRCQAGDEGKYHKTNRDPEGRTIMLVSDAPVMVPEYSPSMYETRK